MRTALLALVASLAAGTAFAQGGELARCVAIAQDAQRLACYDRLFRDTESPVAAAESAPAATQAPPAAAPAPAVAGTAAAATGAAAVGTATQDDFGKEVNAAREKEREVEKSRSRELRAKIAKVDLQRSGAHVLTLDNGQVWLQAEPKIGLVFKQGDEVLIRAAMLGSYLLQHADGKTSTRVTRAK